MNPPPERPIAVIAEDEALGRLLLCEAAVTAGLSPSAFEDGLAALEAVAGGGASIVLLDVDMPGMDGYAVCRAIRSRPELKGLPIVMVTGHDDTQAIDRAFEAGATDYISKPVNWALLPHRLAYVLRNAGSVQRLADREAKLQALVDSIPEPLWIVSASGAIKWSPNQRGEQIVHRGPLASAALVPAPLAQRLNVAIRDTAADGRPRHLEYRTEDAATGETCYEMRMSRCADGDVLLVRQDTTERVAAAARIERLAYYDPLTGLGNRQRFIDIAVSMLDDARAEGECLAVIYLDLNGFKRVNDSFGHSIGDLVLQCIAKRLAAIADDVHQAGMELSLARLGGDEFALLLRHPSAREHSLIIAQRCRDCLSEPVVCNQLEFFTAPSIGVAVYPEDGDDIETLLKNADTAMYQGKAAGLSEVVAYSAQMSARVRDWHALEARLRRAVREDLLDLRFQPKIRLSDNSLAGVEALTRWYDDQHGEVPPGRFVDIAEESGLIIDMGAWLVGAVCAQLREWLDAGFAVPIAINISGKDLAYGDPAAIIRAETERLSIPASLIEIEITETILVNDSGSSRSAVQKLRDLGCRIALDDFGTGFSSLAYLSRFPPHRLKIDRSFVANVDNSASDAAIVNAMMSLAKSLGLTVTAEGVERPEQLQWLRACGCHEAQGYLLSRPLTAVALEERFLRGKVELAILENAAAQATAMRAELVLPDQSLVQKQA